VAQIETPLKKQVMKHAARLLARLFAKLYPPSLATRIRMVWNALYSCWLGSSFGRMGRNPYIQRPAHIKGARYIETGDRFTAGYNTRIEAWDHYQGVSYRPKIRIGDRVCLNNDCHIGAIDEIVIDDDVLIGSRVLITDHDHGKSTREDMALAPALRKLHSKGRVHIHRGVWIGEGAAILSGVSIGENSVVAANSVVTKSMPANCVIGGIPARVIKKTEV
jgi:acetyltransferase-like isoleucine patch superfamily enzyme